MIKSKSIALFVTGKGRDSLFPPDATDIHLTQLYQMQVQGLCNRMYVFSTSYKLGNRQCKKDFVLRIGRGNAEARMAREYRALKTLKAEGIPVPTAIALELDRNVIDAPFMVMEKINGMSSSNFMNNCGNALAIVDMLAKLMASLHKVDSNILLQTEMSGDMHTCAVKFCRNTLSELRDQINIGYITSLSPLIRHKYLKALEKLEKVEIQRSPMTLIHADFGPDHVLLSDNGPVIMDWEGLRIGDPAYDLGWLYHVIRLEGQTMIEHRFVKVLKGTSLGYDIGKECVECYSKHNGSVPANLEFYKDLAALKLSATLDLHIRPGFACLSRIFKLRPTEIPSQTILAYGTIRLFKKYCELFLRARGIL